MHSSVSVSFLHMLCTFLSPHDPFFIDTLWGTSDNDSRFQSRTDRIVSEGRPREVFGPIERYDCAASSRIPTQVGIFDYGSVFKNLHLLRYGLRFSFTIGLTIAHFNPRPRLVSAGF